jgi:hypothetical protein
MLFEPHHPRLALSPTEARCFTDKRLSLSAAARLCAGTTSARCSPRHHASHRAPPASVVVGHVVGIARHISNQRR